MISISSGQQPSTLKRTAFAAACALGLAAAVLFAHHAMAQTAPPSDAHLAPGQSVEMIGSAAVVTSTVHYQAMISLDCTAIRCVGDFNKPGAKRQLNVTRVSCIIISANSARFLFGSINLYSPTAFVLEQWLPIDSPSSDDVHTLNRAVDLQVGAKQHLQVEMRVTNGLGSSAACTATGTLSTLG